MSKSKGNHPPLEPGLSLEDVLHIIEEEVEAEEGNDNTPIDIFITPPNSGEITDKDSADEDEGGTADNLPGRFLAASAEIRYSKHQHNIEIDDTLGKKKSYKWTQGDLERPSNNENFNKCLPINYSNMNITDILELFLDEDIINFIANESNKYAIFINCPNPNITANEINVFISILFLSGYNWLPGKRMYWETEDDVKNVLVSNSTRRDRFLEIMRFIHCADNSQIDKNDKFYKVRELANKMSFRFKQHFIPTENLSYDEAMIKYFGKHGCKQFIKGKPIRFGFKSWCLNTDNGYLLDFEFYQGKSLQPSEVHEKLYGKAAAPLVKMLEGLPEDIKKKQFSIFFDNLFTGMNLLSHLKSRGMSGTGTIRENRIPKNCPLLSKKEMMKKDRGFHNSSLEVTEGIQVTKWMDNSVVAIASTAYGVEPLSTVKRFLQKQKKIIQVPQPCAIKEYNYIWEGLTGWTRMSMHYELGYEEGNGGGACSPGC